MEFSFPYRIIAAIPARKGSSRFPNKPLATLLGKPMILWVVEGISQAQIPHKIFVVTDDSKIADCVKYHTSAQVVLTDSDIPSGTDRIYQGLIDYAKPEDLILNIQGDEPLVSGDIVDQLAHILIRYPQYKIGTLVTYLRNQEELMDRNVVKVVLNQHHEAIYFSRWGIPYSHRSISIMPIETSAVYRHMGFYAYKFDFLKLFCHSGPCDLEKAESLEQLRALYLGYPIKVAVSNNDSFGVDVPSDIPKVEAIMRNKKMYG